VASIWDWVDDYRVRAEAAGDLQRVALTEFHPAAYYFRETNPERALMIFDEGRRLAQALGEPAWVLFFDHWRATAYMHFMRDFSGVLDLVVQNTLEARKPAYDNHPLRFAAFDDLLAAYLGIDPLGYVDLIEQSLKYLEREIPDEPDSARYLLLARERSFAMERRHWGDARRISVDELALTDADPERHRARHFAVFVHSKMCEIAYNLGDWDALGSNCRVGEELAQEVGHQLELSELIAWHAVLLRHEGKGDEAERFYRTARLRYSRLRMPPTSSGFNALIAYHELKTELPRVLAVRREELAGIQGRGRLGYECHCRVHICELLARMGEPFAGELEAARRSAAKLRRPDEYHARLARLP
jgi:hypothetical protein